ncbi:hypothetical protein GCM10009737_21460 [Nocardioides lentus]|uniref:GAF domain-containing protein n=1 Tax=Nocardioides lentus TaxID=338077 RepID=A0ABN2PED5_9ACTN
MTYADTLSTVTETLRHAVRASGVTIDCVRGDDPPAPPGGSTYSLEVGTRGSVRWRVGVEREDPLDETEKGLVAGLARLLRAALTAAEDHDTSRRLADLVDATLLELDTMIGATVEERMVKVAREVAEVLDVTGWAVRILVDGEWMLVAHEHRRGFLHDPLTAWGPFDPRSLALEEGSIALGADDDSAVGAALRHCGLGSLVAAAGFDPDAVSWTMCMVGDEVSGDLAPGRTALAALVPAALGFPLPPRSGGLLRSVG